MLRLAVTPSVASGIDYLSIRLFVGEQMRAAKRPIGGIPPNGSFLVLQTSKINQHGIIGRTIPYPIEEMHTSSSPRQVSMLHLS
jgi:hypothetical protein